MRGGDLLVGSFDGGQVGYHRPFAEAGQYRTPIAGLYQASSATHGGGGVCGIPGHHAAREILRDRKRARLKRLGRTQA